MGITFFFAALAADVFAADPRTAPEVFLPPLLKEVQTEYRKSAGIEAQFEQVTEIKSTKQRKTAQGRIWIKRPNQLRWETLSPDPNILISDGKTFWFYTPPFEQGERGQVIIKNKGQVQTQFLNALLSGTFNFGQSHTSIESKSDHVFVLKPQKGTAGDVVSATIEVSPDSKKIHSVLLGHSSGNLTEIHLKEIKLTSKFDDTLFHFVPDHNTDKIVE